MRNGENWAHERRRPPITMTTIAIMVNDSRSRMIQTFIKILFMITIRICVSRGMAAAEGEQTQTEKACLQIHALMKGN